MKRTAKLPLAIALFLSCGTSLSAQSAENIIERHIKSLGGKKALKAVTSVRIAGSVTRNAAAGEPGEFLWQTRTPGSLYMETRFGEQHRIEAYNGKSGWTEDSTGGLRTLTGREQARARATALYRNDHFRTYKQEKTKVRLVGRETIAGHAAFALELTTRSGLQRKLFFDAQNYLLLKDEEEREGGREEFFFGDYRAVDGVLEPFRITLRRGGETLDVTVREVAHNRGVSSAVFDFPNRSARPLPDLPAMLSALVKNQKKIDDIREDYTFTSKETEIEIDGKGNIKPKSDETYEVFFVHGRQVKKLVQKEGKPLSEAEQRKEEERVVKRIREIEQRKKEHDASAAKKAADQKQRGNAGAEKDDDGFGISDFLRVCQLVNPRRERFSGREVIVFEFEPRPGYKARNRAESIAQKLVGVMWVDEDAQEVVRLEARTTDSIRVGGGLVASLGKGAEFVFEQDRINNEIWLPRYAEVNLSARLLLVAGIKVHRTERFSDYKKFRIETRQEFKPPADAKPPENPH
ncbi:MAG TPA: hypothetical protein VGQ11_01745 [Candidatus Acidoferrales bacterium]|nr:hypothetical protein [Candidatus Acidoferrales bacterium]